MRQRTIWSILSAAAVVLTAAATVICLVLLHGASAAQERTRLEASLVSDLHRLEFGLVLLSAIGDGSAGEAAAPGALAGMRRQLEGIRSVEQTPAEVRDLLLRCDARLSQAAMHGAPERAEELAEAAALARDAARVARETEILSLAEAGRLIHRGGLAGAAAALLGVLAVATLALRQRFLAGRARSAQRSRLLAAAVRSVEEGVLISDAGGAGREPVIVFVNRSLCAMTGRKSDELVGHPLHALRDRSLDISGFDGLEPSYSDTRSATIETVGQGTDGSRRHLEWHISPVRTEGGRITHYVSIIRDITELREREVALGRAATELEQANRRLRDNQQQLIQAEKMASIGRLSAGVAHEINNPVGYVMSNLEMVAEDLERLADAGDEDDVKELVGDLRSMVGESQEGLAQVRDIVQRLKNFARPDDGVPEAVDVNQLVENALRIAGSELKHKCRVETRLGDLPTLWGRPGQLAQVLTNLLVNAGQAIPDEGTVTVETRAEGEQVVVDVSDTGVGIPPEHLGDLFTPFFTTKPVGQGTGLGLSVSYGIVTGHGGTIEVESEPGRGSRFRVTLPLGEKP